MITKEPKKRGRPILNHPEITDKIQRNQITNKEKYERKKKCDILQEELNDFKDKHQNCDDINEAYIILKEEHEKLKGEHEKILLYITSLKEQLDKIKDDYNILSIKNTKLNELLNNKEDIIKNNNNKLNIQNDIIKRLNESNDNLKIKIDQLELNYNLKIDENSKLLNNLDTKEEVINRLNGLYEKLSEKYINEVNKFHHDLVTKYINNDITNVVNNHPLNDIKFVKTQGIIKKI